MRRLLALVRGLDADAALWTSVRAKAGQRHLQAVPAMSSPQQIRRFFGKSVRNVSEVN